MIKLFLFAILFVSSIGSSLCESKTKRIQNVFIKFFDSNQIQPSKCFDNTQILLEELFENEKRLKGYVVGFDKGIAITHLNDRWADGETYDFDKRKYIKEKWTNGTPFKSQNYNEHYFLVIDDRAYDFTQAGKKTQTLRSYLQKSYLPPKGHLSNARYIHLGNMDRPKIEGHLAQTRLRVFPLREYSEKGRLAKPIYTGKASDLFKHKGLIDGSGKKLSAVINKISPVSSVIEPFQTKEASNRNGKTNTLSGRKYNSVNCKLLKALAR